ncbi:hypothetical protein [Aeromicrobium sp. Root495]|uniref:hypothetical protein n=1 Tax=Aeromicrobium sp. Root495 TaxID=1736550 RepID=UPI000AA02AE4|nr:hypothetical protein [Aeromicrobium sp. Root495]
MTMHATAWATGPIGPETIALPGETQQLRNAVQGIRGLCRQVEQAANQLKQANPPEGQNGKAVTALSRAAQRTGRQLEADSQQLERLGDAIDHASDVLGNAQQGVDDLKRRWRDARETFRDALHGAKNAPKDVGALIHSVDADVSDGHGAQFKRQAGLQFTSVGQGQAHAMLVQDGSKIEHAITAYRHAARSIVDEYSDLMQKVKNADEKLAEKLPRQRDHATAEAQEMNGHEGGGNDHQGISAPAGIRSVAEEIHAAAQTIDQAAHRLEDIRLAIRAGRMLPEDERVGSNDGFKRDWDEHFDKVRHQLNGARRAADHVADRLRDADENGAADIRQALRDD